MNDQVDDANAMNAQGARDYERGNYVAAIAAFTQAILLSPEPNWAFYFNRGRARDDSGDLSGAIADYSESMRHNPEHSWSYRRRGLARLSEGNLDGAEEDFSRDLRLQSNVYSFTERGYVVFAKEISKALALILIRPSNLIHRMFSTIPQKPTMGEDRCISTLRRMSEPLKI